MVAVPASKPLPPSSRSVSRIPGRVGSRIVAQLRRFSSFQTGLQARLILSFMGMLALALGFNASALLTESRAILERRTDEQALELANTATLSIGRRIAANDRTALDRVSRNMLDNVGVSAATIYDASGHELSSATARSRIQGPGLTESLGGFRRGLWRTALPGFGRFVVATLPVHAPDSSVVGFVRVCVSAQADEARLQQLRVRFAVVGSIAVFCCLVIASALIHKLFNPIRCLVGATHQIIAGDLDAKVAIDRRDVIGTLAKSFNQMVNRVRQQQEALAAVNRELESKVRIRTAELEAANQRLSSEIAEKEDFLRAVSHDLSAPLRNIAGMAMMLMRRREQLDADVIHRLERIQKNVEVETDLITELLELSRIKTRRLKMEAVSVRAVVEDVVGMFDEEMRACGIIFMIDTPLPTLNCERIRLRQVFQNLIDNAIKYMGERQARLREIHVGCATTPEGAEFFVRDTGIGIAVDDLARIFNVFRRGANARMGNIPGKGVGLSSVKSIIETYDGNIWADSTVGEGTTFRFTISGKYVTATDSPPLAPPPMHQTAA